MYFVKVEAPTSTRMYEGGVAWGARNPGGAGIELAPVLT